MKWITHYIHYVEGGVDFCIPVRYGGGDDKATRGLG